MSELGIYCPKRTAFCVGYTSSGSLEYACFLPTITSESHSWRQGTRMEQGELLLGKRGTAKSRKTGWTLALIWDW